jgi:hypothetical protein
MNSVKSVLFFRAASAVASIALPLLPAAFAAAGSFVAVGPDRDYLTLFAWI